jgi:hypothetical protein
MSVAAILVHLAVTMQEIMWFCHNMDCYGLHINIKHKVWSVDILTCTKECTALWVLYSTYIYLYHQLTKLHQNIPKTKKLFWFIFQYKKDADIIGLWRTSHLHGGAYQYTPFNQSNVFAIWEIGVITGKIFIQVSLVEKLNKKYNRV